MKSQDIFLALKIISLELKGREQKKAAKEEALLSQNWWQKEALLLQNLWEEEAMLLQDSWQDEALLSPNSWQDWELTTTQRQYLLEVELDSSITYSVRELARVTGISKSQVSLSLNRCYENGLMITERITGIPRVNKKILLAFIKHGLKLVFPVKPGVISRGIATGFSAPVLNRKIFSSGEMTLVWPNARGNSKGQALTPLYSSVSNAVQIDPNLYAMLALVDAIRVGLPRESELAFKTLSALMGINE